MRKTAIASDRVVIEKTGMYHTAEFYSELADWAYANGEAMLMEDEPEMQDYENQ